MVHSCVPARAARTDPQSCTAPRSARAVGGRWQQRAAGERNEGPESGLVIKGRKPVGEAGEANATDGRRRNGRRIKKRGRGVGEPSQGHYKGQHRHMGKGGARREVEVEGLEGRWRGLGGEEGAQGRWVGGGQREQCRGYHRGKRGGTQGHRTMSAGFGRLSSRGRMKGGAGREGQHHCTGCGGASSSTRLHTTPGR